MARTGNSEIKVPRIKVKTYKYESTQYAHNGPVNIDLNRGQIRNISHKELCLPDLDRRKRNILTSYLQGPRIIKIDGYLGGVRALTIETIVALPAVNVPPQ